MAAKLWLQDWGKRRKWQDMAKAGQNLTPYLKSTTSCVAHTCCAEIQVSRLQTWFLKKSQKSGF